MKFLCIIPARGGSKGIPRKNIKELRGKPLIGYTIDVARSIFRDVDICVTTDDSSIIDIVENQFNLHVPFVRPFYLATDTSGSYEVLLHAIEYYETRGFFYDAIVLLQPTSPFRTSRHVKDAMALYSNSVDMVVSVVESDVNPYYNLFEEDNNGFLHLSKGEGDVVRRQDAPRVYEYNGAVYVINIQSLKKEILSKFKRKIKYVMDKESSLDLDTMYDWNIAEMILQQKNKRYD